MPPTQISGSPWTSAWNSTTSPKLAPTGTGTFAVSTGDLIVVEAVDENNGAFGTPTNAAAVSAASITWTLRQSTVTPSHCRAAAWTGAVTAGGNAQISLTQGAQMFGIVVWAFSAHGGVGQSVGNTGTAGTAPSLAPGAAWTASSTVCCANGDWSAVSHGATTRDYRVNLGAATERNYSAVDGNYTTEAWEHTNAGASPGSGAVGLNTPNQTWAMVGVEVLPAAGGPTIVSGSDSGTGTDATSSRSVTASSSQTATGTDSASASISASSTDTATGADAGTLSAQLPGSDSGSGSEVASASATGAASDSGAGTDSGSVSDITAGPTIISGADSGTGSDTGTLRDLTPPPEPPLEEPLGDVSEVDFRVRSDADRGRGFEVGLVVDLTPAPEPPPPRRLERVFRRLVDADDGLGREGIRVEATVRMADSAAGRERADLLDLSGEDEDERFVLRELLGVDV